MADRAIENAATKAVRQLGYTAIKQEQLKVVTGVLQHRDVFTVLPTGYMEEPVLRLPTIDIRSVTTTGPDEPSIVPAVTPLTAIMLPPAPKRRSPSAPKAEGRRLFGAGGSTTATACAVS